LQSRLVQAPSIERPEMAKERGGSLTNTQTGQASR
jgi:hypothetical protein